jgi:hypothetical protein
MYLVSRTIQINKILKYVYKEKSFSNEKLPDRRQTPNSVIRSLS